MPATTVVYTNRATMLSGLLSLRRGRQSCFPGKVQKMGVPLQLLVYSLLVLAPLGTPGAALSPVPSTEPAALTLTRVGQTDRFLLEIRNDSPQPLALLKWPWNYELRFYDRSGRDITGQWNYWKAGEMIPYPEPHTWDWVVLQPEESFSFPLYPQNKQGRTSVPSSAMWAKATASGFSIVEPRPPDFIRASGAKVVYPVLSSPRIRLQPDRKRTPGNPRTGQRSTRRGNGKERRE